MRFTLLLLFLILSQLIHSQEYLQIKENHEVVDSVPIYTEEIDSNGVLYSTRSYFDTKKNKLARVCYYRNGKKNGIYQTFFPEGGLMEFAVYGNGIKHGEYTLYNRDGSIAIKGKFKNNLKHGFWIYKNDDCYGRFKKGKKKGTWRCFVDFKEIKTKY